MQQDPGPRVLVVMRHAHAEGAAASDSERRLTDQGRQEARAAGEWLAGRGLHAEHALVSAAVRARETWEAVAAGAGWTLEPDVDRGLYSADTDSMLDLLRLVPGEARKVLVVGHNPTVATLVQLLDDGEGDAEAGTRMLLGYPPAALTVLEHDGDWADLGHGTARVAAFHVPHP